MPLEGVPNSNSRQAFLLAKSWHIQQEPKPLIPVSKVAEMVYPALEGGWDTDIILEALGLMTAWTTKAMDFCLKSASNKNSYKDRAELRTPESIDVPKPTPDQVARVKELLRETRADLRASSERRPELRSLEVRTEQGRQSPATNQSPIPPPPAGPPLRLLAVESAIPLHLPSSCPYCKPLLFGKICFGKCSLEVHDPSPEDPLP